MDIIEKEKITYLFKNSPNGLLVNFLMSALAFAVLWGEVGHQYLWGWIAAVYIINIARIFQVKLVFKRIKTGNEPVESLKKRENLFFALSVLSGLAWGSLSFVPVFENGIINYVFIAFILGAMAIGSLPLLSISPKISISYILLTLVPISTRLFWFGEPMFLVMGTMALVFIAIALLFGKNLHTLQVNSFELKNSNVSLINDLKHANEKLEDKLYQQMKISETIQEAYEFEASIMDNSLSGIYVLDLNGEFLKSNSAIEKITGFNKEELFGMSYKNVIHEKAVNEVVKLFKTIITEGATIREFKTRLIRKNGSHANIIFTASPIQKSGKIVGVLGSVEDVTLPHRVRILEKARLNMLEMLASGQSLENILEIIIDNIEKVNEDMICSVHLLDESGKKLLHGAAPGLPEFYNKYIHELSIGQDVGCCGTAAYTKKRVISANVREDPKWVNFQEITEKAGLQACWSQPILGKKDEVLGTFAIYFKNPQTPDGNDIQVIEECSQIVQIAIERKQMENEMIMQNKALSLLFDTSSVLIQAGKLDTLFEEVSKNLAGLEELKISRHIKIFQKGEDALELLYDNKENVKQGTRVNRCAKVQPGQCLCGKALETKEVIISFNSQEDAEHTLTDENSEPHGHIIIPLIGRDGINGVLCLYTEVRHISLNQSIHKMFHSLGRQIGILLENAALMEELRARSIYDPLTGLSNRYHMNLVLDKWLPRAKRGDFPISVVLLDIDYFKNYNDTYGHNAGDKVLLKTAVIIENEIREEDMAVRYGGEEFLVILPDTPVQKAGEIAERIRKSMENAKIVTVSAGVTSLKSGDNLEMLIEKADKYLYEAKRSGRNKIILK
ncbi:MAG: diguanylate cyclase [Leptospirales bacterium]